METKFLSDGRKVAVVGSLNSVEFIVQEIFVTKEGDEIPSGERFTTKSLHDAPVESYAKREAGKIEQNLQKLKADEEKIKAEIRKLEDKRKMNQQIVDCIRNLTKSFENFDVQYMADVLTGNIKYAIQINEWGVNEPIEFEEAIAYKDRGRFESLKLLSVFGRSNGELSYKISEYYDGSGSRREYIFARDKTELKGIYEEIYRNLQVLYSGSERTVKEVLSVNSMKILIKYGVEIPLEIKEAIVSREISQKEETKNKTDINYAREKINYENEIKELKNLL